MNYFVKTIVQFILKTIHNRRMIGVIVALVISGLVVSLIWPNGQPISAAGFLTSTTDANNIAH